MFNSLSKEPVLSVRVRRKSNIARFPNTSQGPSMFKKLKHNGLAPMRH